MDIKCFKCSGTGYLPQYSWNQGGICFTCNGTGTVKTMSTTKLNKLNFFDPIIEYIAHSSNRDLAHMYLSGEFNKLDERPKSELNIEFKKRAKEYYGIADASTRSNVDIAKEVIKKLDKLESIVPDTYKKSPQFTADKVSLVPVHWLKKFQGNELRRDKKEMKEFSEKLMEEGLKDPVLIIIGQSDRKVQVGEGNHRLFAYIQAGMDYVPARVARQTRINANRGLIYDRMSNVPIEGYYKGDAKPDEVFDTYYDKGYETKMTEEHLVKLEHTRMELGSLEGFSYGDNKDFKLFSNQFEKPSKKLVAQMDSMIQFVIDNGGTEDDVMQTLANSMEWKSRERGFVTIDVKRAIKDLSEHVELYGESEKATGMGIPEPTEKELQEMMDDPDWLLNNL